MARFKYSGRTRDSYGNIVPNSLVSVYISGINDPMKLFLTEAASGYSNVPPQITSDSQGYFEFWVDNIVYPYEPLIDLSINQFVFTQVNAFKSAKYLSFIPPSVEPWEQMGFVPQTVYEALNVMASFITHSASGGGSRIEVADNYVRVYVADTLITEYTIPKIQNFTAVDMSNNKITNVADGTTLTDAVNVNQLTQAGGVSPETFKNMDLVDIVKGHAVYISGENRIKLASADNLNTSYLAGFAIDDIAVGENGTIITDGIVSLTEDEWRAVTDDSQPLSAGANYFLSDVQFGNITKTPTEIQGNVIMLVGRALTKTELKIEVDYPIVV